MTDDSKFVLRWEVDNATAKFAAGTVESEVFHKRGFEWMTDDSKIVLRWEIDNAQAKFATGRVESKVFDQGGFKWIVSAVKDRNDKINYILKCDTDHNEEWRCDAEIEVRHYYRDGITFDTECTKKRFCFEANVNNIWIHNRNYSWTDLTNSYYLRYDDKIMLEFIVNIISSESGEPIVDPAMFAAPNRRSDVILKIGDEKLHVSKEFLSVHSPVFEALFFGEFTEKGKEEVELKDVDYKEFLDLLHLIYLKTMQISDRTVVHIVKLADRFQMEDVLQQAKMHLIKSKGIDVMTKLLLSDQYSLVDLKEKCFRSFTTAMELHENIQKFPEFDKFSVDMKAAICDRIMKLKVQ